MKVLLPPSETKRPGGVGVPLDLASLALPGLLPERETVTEALIAISADAERARGILKLSERQLADIQANRMLRTAPTMPAIDRYTGVLYEALDAASLDGAARRWIGRSVWIQTAPWGPVAALDAIPAYRLAAGTALPGIRSLKAIWADAASRAIAVAEPGFVLDLRSDAYVALGPVPASRPSAYVRVVTAGGRALNHFNKRAKGLLVRALAESRPRLASPAAFVRWAASQQIDVRPGHTTGELELVTTS